MCSEGSIAERKNGPRIATVDTDHDATSAWACPGNNNGLVAN